MYTIGVCITRSRPRMKNGKSSLEKRRSFREIFGKAPLPSAKILSDNVGEGGGLCIILLFSVRAQKAVPEKHRANLMADRGSEGKWMIVGLSFVRNLPIFLCEFSD